ncbi:MAG: hypothetical protein J6Y89_04405, partial [Lachnospiraceae bacterium]|nr:hypothetical protein [Lachnospiraceae bacterium]
MTISDFLNSKDHRKKILIVSNLGRGQALLRHHEGKTGAPVCNVSCMTLRQAAEMLYMWSCAESGYRSDFRLADSKEAMMLLRSVVVRDSENQSYFKNPNMMDVATAAEMFRIVNLIRSNGWTGKEPANERIDDLKKIISRYEQALIDRKILDTVALYQYVRSISMSVGEVRAILGADVYYLAEDTEGYSGLEKRILENVLGCNSDSCLKLFTEELSVKSLCNIAGKAVFYKGYGAFNEANYIANDIFAGKLRYGSVAVLHSSQTQLPAVTSALRGNRIETRIVSGYPVADNAYIALVRRILDWAEDDFSETGLEAVLLSPVLAVFSEEEGKKRNLLAGQRYFNHVLKAGREGFSLGWGYERNAEFIEFEENYIADKRASLKQPDEAQEKYLDDLSKILGMHKAVLNIFGDGTRAYDGAGAVNAYVICSALVEFVKTYGMPSPEFAVGMEAVYRVSTATEFDSDTHELAENIRLIRELTDRITVSDRPDSGSVLVKRLGEWDIIDRDNVYVTGLSLKDMQGDTTQSPILFDNEMNEYLGAGYKPTVENEAVRREKNILRTLMLFDGKSITFGYSSYDTVGFCESNPSGLYRDLLKEYGGNTDIKDLPEFVYGNPDAGVKVDRIQALPPEIELECAPKQESIVPEMPVTDLVSEDGVKIGEFTGLDEDEDNDALKNGYGFDFDEEEFDEAEGYEVQNAETDNTTDESEKLYGEDEYAEDEYLDDEEVLTEEDELDEEEEYDEEDEYLDDDDYYNGDYEVDVDEIMNQDFTTPQEDAIQQVTEHYEVLCDTSNSALEQLLDCPKKYAFNRV